MSFSLSVFFLFWFRPRSPLFGDYRLLGLFFVLLFFVKEILLPWAAVFLTSPFLPKTGPWDGRVFLREKLSSRAFVKYDLIYYHRRPAPSSTLSRVVLFCFFFFFFFFFFFLFFFFFASVCPPFALPILQSQSGIARIPLRRLKYDSWPLFIPGPPSEFAPGSPGGLLSATHSPPRSGGIPNGPSNILLFSRRFWAPQPRRSFSGAQTSPPGPCGGNLKWLAMRVSFFPGKKARLPAKKAPPYFSRFLSPLPEPGKRLIFHLV